MRCMLAVAVTVWMIVPLSESSAAPWSTDPSVESVLDVLDIAPDAPVRSVTGPTDEVLASLAQDLDVVMVWPDLEVTDLKMNGPAHAALRAIAAQTGGVWHAEGDLLALGSPLASSSIRTEVEDTVVAQATAYAAGPTEAYRIVLALGRDRGVLTRCAESEAGITLGSLPPAVSAEVVQGLQELPFGISDSLEPINSARVALETRPLLALATLDGTTVCLGVRLDRSLDGSAEPQLLLDAAEWAALCAHYLRSPEPGAAPGWDRGAISVPQGLARQTLGQLFGERLVTTGPETIVVGPDLLGDRVVLYSPGESTVPALDLSLAIAGAVPWIEARQLGEFLYLGPHGEARHRMMAEVLDREEYIVRVRSLATQLYRLLAPIPPESPFTEEHYVDSALIPFASMDAGQRQLVEATFAAVVPNWDAMCDYLGVLPTPALILTLSAGDSNYRADTDLYGMGSNTLLPRRLLGRSTDTDTDSIGDAE
ncbi:MAG: hypothetical protein GF320_00865 [Armatimonadia bacterium]|nr:hypothetical protein [Armatimonadia bacterium]